MSATSSSIIAARYQLARHVPAMLDGFTIRTSQGELRFTAEESRRHPAIRHEVESLLRFRLHEAERAEVQS